jgi:hypothetical protein
VSRPSGSTSPGRRPTSTRFFVLGWTIASVRRGVSSETQVLRAWIPTPSKPLTAAMTASNTGLSPARSAYWASVSSSALASGKSG